MNRRSDGAYSNKLTAPGRGLAKFVGLVGILAITAIAFEPVATGAVSVRPDLVTNKVSGPPDVSGPGHTFSAVARTANVGDKTAGATHELWYLTPVSTHRKGYPNSASRRIGRFALDRVGAKRTVNLFVQLLIPNDVPQDTYALTACADGYHKLAERSESNNCATSPFFVYVTSAIPFPPDA